MTRNGTISLRIFLLLVCIAPFLIPDAHTAHASAPSAAYDTLTQMRNSPLTAWDQVRERFREAAADGEDSFGFTLSRGLLDEVRADNSLMWYWGARGGAADFTWSWYSDGRISVKELAAWDIPWRTAGDRAEYVAAVSDMRDMNAERFVVLMDGELYQLHTQDERAALEMRLEAGLAGLDTWHSNDGKRSMEYRGCVYWDGGFSRADTEREVLAAMDRMAGGGYGAFAVSLGPEAWQSLSANHFERLHALEALAGVEGGMTYYSDERVVRWMREGATVWYPGVEILQAVRTGEESLLAPRLRQTLQKARELVSGVSGTGKEMALQIHDLLCGHVTYTIDESTDEDDRCVGALLNGQANCDGYADAYLLLCGLKGIPVRLVHGDDLNPDDPLDDSTHLWNLVLLDGTWRSTDVTWDDNDDGRVSWSWYNIGLDRMRAHYVFAEDLLPGGMLQTTDLTDRPIPEFEVSSAAEATDAVKQARALGADGLTLWMTEALYREYQSAENPVWKWMHLGGMADGSVSHADSKRRVEIREAVWSTSGGAAEVGTERELIAALRNAGLSGTDRVNLYLSEALYARYTEADNPVWKWLNMAGYADASISYSTDSRSLTFTDLVPASGMAVAEADSERGIVSALENARLSGMSEVRLYLSGAMFARYRDADNPVWKWLDTAGFANATVMYNEDSRRLIFTDLVPASGMAVAEADSEWGIVSALENARLSGMSEVRLYLSEAMFARYREADSPVWKWLNMAGYADATVRYNENSRRLIFTDLVPASGMAAYEADTEQELIAALKKGAKAGYREIRLYLSEELYGRFRRKNSIVWTWLEEAGYSGASVNYSDQSRRIIYTDPVR